MKIYFVRHGEALDDVRNEYGGWANAELSGKGSSQVEERAKDLVHRDTKAEIILSSPFKRARQSANIIARELSLPVEEDVYLKERNTYGLLCGVNKVEAESKYSELVAAYENDRPVFGYESYAFLLERVRALVKRLAQLEYEVMICVTHGKLLKALLEDVVGGAKIDKLGDACLVVVGLGKDGSLKLLETDNVTLKS
ncbi:MAG: histidine phosphatase family protein [bacterium]